MQLRVAGRVFGDLEQRHEDVVQHLLEVLDDALLLVHRVQARDLRRGLAGVRAQELVRGACAMHAPAQVG